MSNIYYRLGLDIGIGSVGWAVIKTDADNNSLGIEALGVRTFDPARSPDMKSPASLTEPRRIARGIRRRIRRHQFRKIRARWLFEDVGLISKAELDSLNEQTECIYKIRYEALDRKLSDAEFARLLLHLLQRRGYKSNSKYEEKDEKSDTGKALGAISENAKLLAIAVYLKHLTLHHHIIELRA